MADEVSPNNMRKTTKAAIGFSMAMLAIGPLKDLKEFILGDQQVTNARIEQTMKESFAALDQKLTKHMDDDQIVHRRIRDLDRDDLAALEVRCEKRSDKVEQRVSNLELLAFKAIAKKGILSN